MHVAVSLVREDGTKASIWRDRVRMSELCAETERRLGLTVVDGRERGGLPGAGRAETRGVSAAGPARARAGDPGQAGAGGGRGVGGRGRVRAPATRHGCHRAPALQGGRDGRGGRLQRGAGAGSRGGAGMVRRRPAGPGPSPAGVAGGVVRLGGARRGGLGGVGRASGARWARATKRGSAPRPSGPTPRAGWTCAVERLGGVPAGERARWAAVARETAGVFGAWSARVEAVAPGALARAADARVVGPGTRTDRAPELARAGDRTSGGSPRWSPSRPSARAAPWAGCY